MNKVILNIPEDINLKTFDFSVYVASKMYEDGLVSAGQASEMVGISKRAFIEILGSTLPHESSRVVICHGEPAYGR